LAIASGAEWALNDSSATPASSGRKKILASTTPYGVPFARVACGIMNTPKEVETTLAAIRGLA
jgi:hypothetical protein